MKEYKILAFYNRAAIGRRRKSPGVYEVITITINASSKNEALDKAYDWGKRDTWRCPNVVEPHEYVVIDK